MQDLVTFLHADGLLTRSETLAIKRAARDLRENPVRILRSLNVAAPEDIQHCFKVYFNHSLVTDALVSNLSSEYAALMPVDIAVNYSVFAFGEEGDRLHVAMEDPTDKRTIEALRFFLGREIIPSAANVYQLVTALEKLYGVSPTGSRVQTVLDRARGSGAWSITEKELFARILEERRLREEDMARAVSLVMEKRAGAADATASKKRVSAPKSQKVEVSVAKAEPAGKKSAATRQVSEAAPVPDFDRALSTPKEETISAEDSPEALLAQFSQENLPELGDDDFETDTKPPLALEFDDPESARVQSEPQRSSFEKNTLLAAETESHSAFQEAEPYASTEPLEHPKQSRADGDLELSSFDDLLNPSNAPSEQVLAAEENSNEVEFLSDFEQEIDHVSAQEIDSAESSVSPESIDFGVIPESQTQDLPEGSSFNGQWEGETVEAGKVEELSSTTGDEMDNSEVTYTRHLGATDEPMPSNEEDGIDHFSDGDFVLESLDADSSSFDNVMNGEIAPSTDQTLSSSSATPIPSAVLIVSLSQKAFVKVALAGNLNMAMSHCRDIFADVGLDFAMGELGEVNVIWGGRELQKQELASAPWSGLSGLIRELGRKT